MSDLAGCQWREPGGEAAALTIATFLTGIGLHIEVASGNAAGILPGLSISGGAIIVDPAVPAWPGDMLHEAGHIAVTRPELRAALSEISADPGEEMAAIAWSVAAAKACDIPLAILFHAEGYKGDPVWLADQFEQGQPFGVPLLGWYGMTSAETYPTMAKWLR